MAAGNGIMAAGISRRAACSGSLAAPALRKTRTMTSENEPIALAAFYLCESLLLSLESSAVLSQEEIEGLLKDAAKTLREARGPAENPHSIAAAELIEHIRQDHARYRV